MKEQVLWQSPNSLVSATSETAGMVVGTYPIPTETEGARSIVSDVIIAEEARDILPHDIARRLCTKDGLLSLAAMTVPLEQADRKIVTSEFGTRSVPLAYGRFPIDGKFLYNTILGKGTFLSGQYYSKSLPERILEEDTPWGFFGQSDAQTERYISSHLLAQGFRAGVVIGWIVFDSDRLRTWLQGYWGGKDKWREKLLADGIDIIKNNSDAPVLLIRLCGGTERLSKSYNLHGPETLAGAPSVFRNYPSRRIGDIRRGVRLFLEEAATFPGTFRNYLLGFSTFDEVAAVLTKIDRRQKLSYFDLFTYELFLAGVIKVNGEAIRRAIREYPRLSDYTNLYLVSSYAKDIDTGLVTQDFEEVKLNYLPPVRDVACEYMNETVEQVSVYYTNDFVPFFAESDVIPYYSTVTRLIQEQKCMLIHMGVTPRSTIRMRP